MLLHGVRRATAGSLASPELARRPVVLRCSVQARTSAAQDQSASDVGEGARARKRFGLAGSSFQGRVG